jgi:glycosyltransferase involved in cell wall biosynthesis
MKKTKILHVITSLGIGGAENLLLSYLKNLNQNKFSFYVCCLRDKPDDLSYKVSEFAQIINLKMKSKFNPTVVFRLLKVMKNIQPQIIHTHLFQPRIYTTFAHLLYNRAVLLTHKHSIVNPRKHHIFMLIEMVAILFNKRIIAISDSVKKSLSKYELIPKSKILVLTNSIDYRKFNEISKNKTYLIDKSIVIGTVGRIERVKGINYLLLAMKIILQQYPNARLEIIGDGSQLNELKSLAEKIGISNSVIFFGKLANPIPNYGRMDIFVLPSILEGFGLVLLEAMAAGIPVVATNVHGIKEVVVDGKSGILVPPKNPEAIANAVTRIIEDPQLRKDLVDEGFNRARLFDIQEHLLKLDNLYNNLLGVESYQ